MSIAPAQPRRAGPFKARSRSSPDVSGAGALGHRSPGGGSSAPR